MSAVEIENPIITILRLIESRLRVVKDNGGLANVRCSQANYDRELQKDTDSQITVSKTADPCLPQKHTLDGKLRRRIYALRATIITNDKAAPGSDAGRIMRDKILEQILLIIQENRNMPYRTIYNLYPLYSTSLTHKAYDAAALLEPEPSNACWAELSDVEYPKIWISDDDKHSISISTIGEYAFMLFRFKIASKTGDICNEARKQCLKRVILSFEGCGLAPGGNGVTLKVWNNNSGAWRDPQTGSADTDQTLTLTLTTDLVDYVDDEGFLYLIAQTTNPSDGNSAAVLSCDFVEATVEVRGITFCDIHSYRDTDILDVKPTLFKEEIKIVAWLFESIATS